MIAADARMRFTREDLELVRSALARVEGSDLDRAHRTLERSGMDEVLDWAPVVDTLLMSPMPGPSVSLLFYALVRQALLEEGVPERRMADYCAALLREFGERRRAYRIASVDDREHHFMVDILADLATADSVRQYRLLVHLGNHTLWLGGLFPDRIEAQRVRRGAPDLSYYESLGHRGYAAASDHALAERAGLTDVYRIAAERFPALRAALTTVRNRLALRAA